MQEAIIGILEHARDRFTSWICQYQPWHKENGITERNLSFQIATSFIALVNGGMAFMEVPFAAEDKTRTNKHLDAYLFSPTLALLVESKIFWTPEHIRSVGADIDRMTPELVQQLRDRHSNTLPRQTYGLVIAEAWNSEIADWWSGNDKARPRWNRGPLTNPRPYGTWQFGAITVHQVIPGGTLFWLYGISPQLAPLTDADNWVPNQRLHRTRFTQQRQK